MNRRSILTKTGKGLMEATGKTSALSRDHRNILKEIDGKVSVSQLMQKFAKMTEPELLEALRSMEREGYLREFVGKQEEASRPPITRTPTAPSSADGGEDLDFTAFTPATPSATTKEDAARQAGKREAEDRVRREAEERARGEIEQRMGGEEVERRMREERGQVELKARIEAEARAKVEAEVRARRESEERARREEEERPRREEELRRRAEEEARER